ncbi:hypothetical protein [Pandoraea iniqua]|uniref:hypothetical protein n=1 Tax=Pandoraea iniqua TaxID=2508288 RepID=UPI0012415910|nr:hypothetical protein [Pandoraea iniqua]
MIGNPRFHATVNALFQAVSQKYDASDPNCRVGDIVVLSSPDPTVPAFFISEGSSEHLEIRAAITGPRQEVKARFTDAASEKQLQLVPDDPALEQELNGGTVVGVQVTLSGGELDNPASAEAQKTRQTLVDFQHCVNACLDLDPPFL